MCGRMTLTSADFSAVAEELLAEPPGEALGQRPPRYNVAPTQTHPVVVSEPEGTRRLALATWGFPGKEGGALVINARAETVPFKSMFRGPFVNGRCVVVADGFVEWRKTDRGRQPLWFRRQADGPLYFAGLVAPAGAPGGVPRFVVLTTAPNQLVAPIHDRMPAVLTPAAARAWLAAPDIALLHPAPDGYLVASAVSSRVNSPAHDDPACLLPATDTRQQLSLF